MANDPATNVKRDAYSGGELAALLELFLRNLNTNLEPFDSFQSQLELSSSSVRASTSIAPSRRSRSCIA